MQNLYTSAEFITEFWTCCTVCYTLWLSYEGLSYCHQEAISLSYYAVNWSATDLPFSSCPNSVVRQYLRISIQFPPIITLTLPAGRKRPCSRIPSPSAFYHIRTWHSFLQSMKPSLDIQTCLFLDLRLPSLWNQGKYIFVIYKLHSQ